MTWTDERVELLKKLWTDGLSASQIATELGGVTRNAVIGKVHRLSLSGRAKPAAAPVARARKPAATTSNGRQMPAASRPQPTMQRPLVAGNTALKPLVQPMAEPRRMLRATGGDDVVVPISLHATILTLTEQTCKWPIGDPNSEDFHFCGQRSNSGIPYCEYHSRIAYQPVNDRRRDRKLVVGA